ncbi:MAG: cation:proton antiporter [Candidatus Woesearchaeota archaeon]|nr:cation:proton antiporter [Candidatus Woesearchaeota archaeon]
MGEFLVTLGLMVIGASALALLAKWCKQPLIIGYVLAGIILGPAVTGIVHDWEPILWVSELALIFLMFIIGLELDLNKIRDVGKVSVLVGLFQVTIMTALGWGAGMLFGFGTIPSLYIGLVIAFSSTILVVKLLDERKETSSTVGELALGVLITQDILAVLALALVGTFKSSVVDVPSVTLFGLDLGSPLLTTSVTILVNGLLFVALAFLFFKYIMPWLFKNTLESHELLFISSIAVVFFLAALAGFFQFSLAIGSFVAGIALSTATYSHEVVGRVKPLKDFFLILFFVSLGLQITFADFGSPYVLIGILFVGGMVLKPLVTFILLKLFDYNNHTAFLTSLNLAQMGEFGLILVASGVLAGVLTAQTLTVVVLVTIISMVLSTYFIEYDQEVYHFFRPFVEPWDRIFGTHPEEVRNVPDRYAPEIIIFGITLVTADIITMLRNKHRILVIDYNPARAISYKEQGIPTICSDAIDIDLYESIDFSKAKFVVSVIHDTSDTVYGPSSNAFLIRKIRNVNKHAAIIVTSKTEDRGKKFYKAGATVVLTPAIMGKRILKELLRVHDVKKLQHLGALYFKEMHHDAPFMKEL